jgi:hypothetical protein
MIMQIEDYHRSKGKKQKTLQKSVINTVTEHLEKTKFDTEQMDNVLDSFFQNYAREKLYCKEAVSVYLLTLDLLIFPSCLPCSIKAVVE